MPRPATVVTKRAVATLGVLLVAGVAVLVGCPETPAFPYVCTNGTAASGIATSENAEQCAACAFGFILNASGQCRPVLTPVDTVINSATVPLVGARAVTTATVGDVTYLFVARRGDDGVSVFVVGAGGKLIMVNNVTDDAALQLDGASSAATAVVGGTLYLFVAGSADDGISVFSVGTDGMLTPVYDVTDNTALALDVVTSVATAVAGDTTYLFAAGRDDDGISVFSVGDGGRLTSVNNVVDNENLKLFGVSSVATATMGDTAYLFAAGINDNGVSVFSVGAGGVLTSVQDVADDNSLQLRGAVFVATAVVESATYLFVAGFFDDGVSVFSVASDGMLTAVDNVTDSPTRQLDGASSVATVVVGDATYLFVAGLSDDGVSAFSVAADGALTSVDNIADNDDLALDGAISVATAIAGDTAYLFVAGVEDSGVSAFAIGK